MLRRAEVREDAVQRHEREQGLAARGVREEQGQRADGAAQQHGQGVAAQAGEGGERDAAQRIQRICACTGGAGGDAAGSRDQGEHDPERAEQDGRRPPRRPGSTRAPSLAQTRSRRGSNSSWLLIEPVAQSAPAYVVPTMIISAETRTTTATPVPSSLAARRSSVDRSR